MTEESDEDQLLLGFHGAPSQDELKRMSYVQLCSELEHSKAGTTRCMLLEAEKRKRDIRSFSEPSNAEPHHAGNPTPNSSDKKIDCSNKPIGKVWIRVATAVIAATSVYLLRHHLGLVF